MSILSTNKKLIKVGQDYSAGSGISIDEGVISVTGEFGKTYSAGDNVDIYEQGEQLYISSKDWTNDIANASANAYNEAVAQIPDPFNPDYISAQIDNKLNSSDFTTWQNGQYTTDLQTIEGQINNKLDTSSFSDVSGSFLTAHQSLDGYAKEDWVTAQGYITGVDLSPYYTTAEANSLSSMLSGAIDYVSANADNVEVTNVVQSNSGVWNEVTNKLDATAFSNVSGSFYTNDNPSGFITGVDLSNYYTKDETSGKEELADAFANIPVGDPEVNAYVTNNSASLNGTTDLVQNSSGLWNDVAVYQSNSSNYLTAVDLTPYQTTADMINYAKASALDNITNDFVSLSSNINSNSGKWNDITAYQNASAGYLTAHQSLADYATTADLALKQDTLTFDYDEQNKISAINNSAIAGGSNFSGITYTGSYIDGNEETVNYTAVATGISTDYDGVISTLKFTSGNNSNINKYLMAKRLANGTIASGTDTGQPFKMSINPTNTPFTYKEGIFAPLTYATGACLTYGSTGEPGWSVDSATNQYYGAFFKGNEIFISNAMKNVNQALRLETHHGRGVHISGANMRNSSYFDVSVNGLKIGTYNSATSSWETRNYNKAAYDRWNEVSSKLDNSALEYNAVNEITGIAGSAIAGGGDVPEDVMVESAIGYNAVNEISGYNGSAIAQYGAEKQWLVHDDTLVHAANSAQYALGVNLSAVAQLLGVDETVLFDNSGNVGKANISAYTLSESVNNFDRLRISFARGQNFYGDQCFEYNVNTYPKMVSLNCYDPSSPNAYRYFCSFTISGSEFTELAGKCGYSQIIGGSLTTTSNNWLHPYKIVGIGRKQ